MARRLGNVLFGLGMVLGLAWIALLGAVYSQPGSDPGGYIVAACGLVFPVIGWSLRYILGGDHA